MSIPASTQHINLKDLKKDKLMKSILICGIGRFGTHLAHNLTKQNVSIMAVDTRESVINSIAPFVTEALIGDATDELFLKDLGVSNFDVCFVAIGDNFRSSMETTSLLKELGAPFVVSRASGDKHAQFLTRIGADDVIYPEKQLGEWAAIRYGTDHVFDYFAIDHDYAIFEVSVPKSWQNRTIGEINIRKNFDISIIGIRNNGGMTLRIFPDTVLNGDETLVVVGNNASLHRCFKI